MKASASGSHAMLRTAGVTAALAIVFMFLTGCSVQKPLRFAPKSISRIQYDPQNCTQMPDGKFLCKDVVFTVNTLDVAAR